MAQDIQELGITPALFSVEDYTLTETVVPQTAAGVRLLGHQKKSALGEDRGRGRLPYDIINYLKSCDFFQVCGIEERIA